jgi:hypothetical protein
MSRKTNYKKRKKKVKTKRKYSKIKHKQRKYRRKTKNKSLSRKKKNVKGGGVDIDKLTKLSNKYIKSLFHHYNEREEWVDLDDKQRSDVLEQYMEDIEREKKQLKRFFGYGMVQGDESKRYLAKIDTLFEGYKKENPVPEEAVISDIILSKEEVHELFKSLEDAAAGGSLKKNEVKKTQKLKRKKKNVKGGYFEIDRQKVQNWENIHSKDMDCCPCVFNLLGLDREESFELIEKFGNTGMKNDELTEFLKSKYPGYSFSLKQTGKKLNDKIQKIIKLTDLQVSIEDKKKIYSKYRIDYSEEVNNFLKVIPENYGVIGITRSAMGINHCIVFAKMNGRLVYYDAQGMISIVGKEKIGRHLIEQRIYQIGYVMGTETAQHDIAGPWIDLYSDREWGSVKPGLKTKKRNKYSPSIFADITTDGQ